MRRVLGLLLLFACGKTDAGVPHLDWLSVDTGERIAAETHRPLLVFVGAEWDAASKQLEHVTFRDVRVRARIAKHFVTAYSDMTDDELLRTRVEKERLSIIGTPAIVVRTPEGDAEVGIATSYLGPDELLAFVDRCLARLEARRAVADRASQREPRAYDCR